MKRKCYILGVTQVLAACLICPPSALGATTLGPNQFTVYLQEIHAPIHFSPM